MKLIYKFNLVLLLVGSLGFAATAAVSYEMLVAKAHDESLQNARLMLEAALATRNYTNTNIVHLLETQMKYEFLPESVPSFAATEAFRSLHKTMPDYGYKEATLNPTNPRDRVTDWEADVVNRFREHPELAEISGERDTPSGRSLYLARPITIKDPACIACHDTAADAPRTLIDKYGSSNGFGWKLNETVAAQIVSVPAQVPADRARATFITFIASVAAVFGVVFVALNAMLALLVVRPLNRLSSIAVRVSLGEADVPPFDAGGRDEIGMLAGAFARMRTSLETALELIEQ